MRKNQFFISTIDPDAGPVARKAGFGIEIAEFCTAWNMDDAFAEAQKRVSVSLEGIERRILHAPFNELFPCAIDPRARELAAERYLQAISIAQSYGAEKVVIHGGYNPWIYYPCWYVEQSILFWKAFLEKIPETITVCLENVLEEEPDMLLDIVKAVDDPRLRLCLDIGHVNAYSKISAEDWLLRWGKWISHFHIHNNSGDRDAHEPLMNGSMDIRKLLALAREHCSQATYTLELMESSASVRWLYESIAMED